MDDEKLLVFFWKWKEEDIKNIERNQVLSSLPL